ncbi:bile acid:sodium symporter [Gordonia sp. PKS22-38]|uniref:Bile acid:sodium symporter n=1 Tax=Gordonia prachuapensis TaxID=3115651 RepID=A0ABU7MW60_9ACTN|nr:bile acid:sodium symporter [Gordonia sp. PKS22-38]
MRPPAALPETMERHQVAIYLAAVAVGAGLGLSMPNWQSSLEIAINPAIAGLLYVTFLQVPMATLGKSLRDSRFMAVLLAVNFVVVPIVVGVLFSLLPDEPAIRIGVLLVLLCPCVDYVIVFSGLAGGAGHRLLAATPILLLAQMVLLPVYLTIFMGSEIADVVEPEPFVVAFVVLIAVPLAAAWSTQAAARSVAQIDRFRVGVSTLMVPLVVVVLVVVVASQMATLGDHVRDIVELIPVYVVFLAVMAGLGLLIARRAGLDLPLRRAIAFSGATRNSLVVLPLALALPAGFEVAGAVVVTQTVVEVVGMVALVAIIPRITR